MSRHGGSQGKRMVVVLWSLIFLLMCSVVLAESVSSKDPLIEHLEFLGYECDLVEAGIRAKTSLKNSSVYYLFFWWNSPANGVSWQEPSF